MAHRYGFVPGLMGGFVTTFALGLVGARFLVGGDRWRRALKLGGMLLCGPVLYAVATIALQGEDAMRHHLQLAGLILAVPAGVFLLGGDRWLASKP
jgi:hypothetical protein